MASAADVGRGLTFTLVAFASLAYLGAGGLHTLRDMAVGKGSSLLTMTSSATGDHASITLTNITSSRVYACMRGVVTNTVSRATLASHTVCTGEMAPRSTVHLVAPFRVGAVQDLCFKTIGETKILDWSKCTFEIDDQTR